MIKTYQKLPRALRAATPRADGTEEGINLSSLIDAARCGYRYHLRHRRGIERRTIAPAMDLGSAVHEGIRGGIFRWAAFKTPRITNKRMTLIWMNVNQYVLDWAEHWKAGRGTLTVETNQELGDTIEKAIRIAQRALVEMDLSRWKILRLRDGSPMVEQKITWAIPGTDVPFYGTPDFGATDLTDGSNWVWDYKVRERFVSSEDERFDTQLPTYQFGLSKQVPSIRTAGAIKFQIRSALPEIPKLNKNGTMSRQRIATDWPTYDRALVAAGLDAEDYREEMHQKLDFQFFSLERHYRNDFELRQIWHEITVPMALAHLRRKNWHRVMHTWGCNGCWARAFCLGELRGEDTEFLLATEYVDTTKPADHIGLRPEHFNFRDGKEDVEG